MERRKSQNKEIELLLNALENDADLPEEIESTDLTSDVTDFINAFNIFPGENKIMMTSMYQHYKLWSPTPVTYVIFCVVLKKIFQIDEKRDRLIIHIKNDLIDLNNEVIKTKKAKAYLKKTVSFKKHIESFIEEMELVPSKRWVNIDFVYKWYIQWRYNRKNVKLKRKDLKDLLKFYFESKIGKTRGFFKLKGEFNMHKIEQLREKQTDKRNKTIKIKVPGVKT
jgi:hypothetical protein